MRETRHLIGGIVILALVATVSVAQTGYSDDFEAMTASTTGTPVAGQNGFFVPAVANSNDFNAYFYPGNAFGFPANPGGGGGQFIGQTNAGGVFNSRT